MIPLPVSSEDRPTRKRDLRVLVCGGRTFGASKLSYAERMRAGSGPEDLKAIVEQSILTRALSKLHRLRGVTAIIHGGAWGADNLAGRWAIGRGIKVEIYPANWNTHGKRAGFLRNQQMLADSNPDVVVAFPGGRGTASMIRLAQDAGVPIWEPAKDET